MELKDFISQTLKDLNAGINEAQGDTRKYYVDKSNARGGILFSLAITTSSSEHNNDTKGGMAKIKILEGGVTKSSAAEIRSEQVSRIEFVLHVDSGRSFVSRAG